MDRTDSSSKSSERGGTAGITVRDVARIAGVSAITVSRALNRPEQLNADTLARVLEAVRSSGYVPNRLAGGLRSNRSRLVAAVVPTISGPVFLETIESLTATLAIAGYQLMLGQSGYADSREDDLVEAVIARRPDAIMLTGVVHSDAVRQRLIASGIPIVETWDMTDSPIDMLVGFSHEAIGAAVCEALVAKGARRLALVTGDDVRAQRRLRRFVAAAESAGLAPVEIATVSAPATLAAGRGAIARLLDGGARFDAVFCSSDWVALGVLLEAQSRGLVVPEAFGVIGFGDLAFAAASNPPLSSVRVDGAGIGRRAAEMLVASIEGRAIERRVIDVGFEIVERGTTR